MPEARNAHRQRYCTAPPCRAASKRASHAKWLAKPEHQDYDRGPEAVARAQAWRRAHPGYANYLTAIQFDSPPDIQRLFDRYNEFRILCAIHESSRGVERLNEHMTNEFRRRLAHPMDQDERTAWFPERPLLMLRNDYALRLFNGDIGLTLIDQSGELRVYFPDEDGQFRAIPPGRLPEHETAFAITVPCI